MSGIGYRYWREFRWFQFYLKGQTWTKGVLHKGICLCGYKSLQQVIVGREDQWRVCVQGRLDRRRTVVGQAGWWCKACFDNVLLRQRIRYFWITWYGIQDVPCIEEQIWLNEDQGFRQGDHQIGKKNNTSTTRALGFWIWKVWNVKSRSVRRESRGATSKWRSLSCWNFQTFVPLNSSFLTVL